ncbi:ABC transporter ATP-binding protein [Allopusillimonas ginsengisoli]|uniref:ABC transporter ATP-binding protein n=1 Tax=Allopusillimonas ginsengisoli TaxID=453575 RepID=UPI001020D7B4|nr:ABC transporter ATP-binding protein [Allopusillimonas ginsengisoli]TEA77232.1 ABC transporter ATP-binding protein [Allopusillimonas ginsengisoli]
MTKIEANTPLVAKHLSKQFGGLLAVADMSMEIRDREIVGLIGPNGAGKSTTFNLLSGFLPPTGGRLFIDGKDVTGRQPESISRLGLVRTFQHGSLMRSMTVEDNILIGAIGGMPGATQTSRRLRVQEMAELVGLQQVLQETAGNLPHGMQRLVSIAIAFASHPRLLCLDEPLTGLNQTEVASVLAMFRHIRDNYGSSILLVEHNMKAVMQTCDRLYVLHHGKLLATGTPAEISKNQQVLSAYLGNANVH